MKVLLQYTFRNLKNNKKTTFASMAAVLIASTLLFSLCSIFYNNIAWQADIERYESGGWHAEVGSLPKMGWRLLRIICKSIR